MKNALEIKKIANKVRRKFERKEIPINKLIKLYSNYNNKVNANIFVKEAEKFFPKLNCGLTTIYLKEKLGGEIVHGTYGKDNHTFLSLNPNLIVDITADQYGGPKIYVGELKLPYTKNT